MIICFIADYILLLSRACQEEGMRKWNPQNVSHPSNRFLFLSRACQEEGMRKWNPQKFITPFKPIPLYFLSRTPQEEGMRKLNYNPLKKPPSTYRWGKRVITSPFPLPDTYCSKIFYRVVESKRHQFPHSHFLTPIAQKHFSCRCQDITSSFPIPDTYCSKEILSRLDVKDINFLVPTS